MLATEFSRQRGEYGTMRPLCPNCGRLMYLTRTTPRSDGLPDLCVFKCGECAVWLTESANERPVI